MLRLHIHNKTACIRQDAIQFFAHTAEKQVSAICNAYIYIYSIYKEIYKLWKLLHTCCYDIKKSETILRT